MAGKISDEKLREAFKVIDQDKSGTLSNAEMGRVLEVAAKHQGIELTKEQNEKICTVSVGFKLFSIAVSVQKK